jgi:hypothetical protein
MNENIEKLIEEVEYYLGNKFRSIKTSNCEEKLLFMIKILLERIEILERKQQNNNFIMKETNNDLLINKISNIVIGIINNQEGAILTTLFNDLGINIEIQGDSNMFPGDSKKSWSGFQKTGRVGGAMGYTQYRLTIDFLAKEE